SAVPRLIGYLQHTEPAYCKAFWDMFEKQHFLKIQRPHTYKFQSTASFALQQLGPVAMPALPELIRRLSNTNSIDRNGAEIAIISIGETVRPEVERACSHSDEHVRAAAAFILTFLAPGKRPITWSWHNKKLQTTLLTSKLGPMLSTNVAAY